MVKIGHRQTNKVVAVVFQQYDNILTIHNQPVRKPDDYREALLAGFDKFRSEHPQRGLTGLKIIFDEVD
jgi:hypothetical protein